MSTNENTPSKNEAPVKRLSLVRTTIVTFRTRTGLRAGRNRFSPGCLPSETNGDGSSGQGNG